MMLRKYMIVVLIVGMLNLFFTGSALASTNEEKRAALAERVKSAIGELGTGPTARLEVKLYDKTKHKGYVSKTTDSHFVLVNEQSDSAAEIPYTSVKQIKGQNFNTGKKIAIGVGIVVGLIVIAILIGRS